MEKPPNANDQPVSPAEFDGNVTHQGSATRTHQRHRCPFYMSVFMLAMISLIVAWDVTALSLALPVIAEQLQGTNFESFWASIAFVLGIAVTQPIYASISDVVGRKHVLYVSMALFGIGCVVFATAADMRVLIAGRLIKGLGAGGLDVLQTMILCDITTMKERPRWLAVLSVANAAGAVSGPFVGAVFAEQVGWPWLGWINLVTVRLAGVMAFFFLRLRPVEGGIKEKMSRLDWTGFALFTVIGTIVALPLSWANELYAWGSWQTLVPLLVGVLLLVPFGIVEKRATVPMIPYQIFDSVSIITGTLGGLIYGALSNTVLLYLALFFQAAYLETPLQAAKSTLPICCLVVAMSIIVSGLIDWGRKYLIALWTGWVLTTVFLGLYSTVGTGTSRSLAYAFQALLGAGVGTVLVSIQISVLASVTHVDSDGLAAGMLVTFRFIGSLLGLTVCSTVFSSVFQTRLSSVGQLPQQLAVLKDASKAVSFIPQLRVVDAPESAMGPVMAAYDEAFQTVWIVLAAFSALGALLSVFTREYSLEKDDVGRQGFEVPSSE